MPELFVCATLLTKKAKACFNTYNNEFETPEYIACR